MRGKTDLCFLTKGHTGGHRSEASVRHSRNIVAEFKKNNPRMAGAIARKSALKRKYGISEDLYNELLDEQGGCCAICGKTPDEEGRSLAVDHNHATGEIRGLLCMQCNVRLAVVEDKLFTSAALRYLGVNDETRV